MSDMKIFEDICENSSVKVSEERIYNQMDIVWGHLRFSLLKLANVALILLITLRNNAAEERYF